MVQNLKLRLQSLMGSRIAWGVCCTMACLVACIALALVISQQSSAEASAQTSPPPSPNTDRLEQTASGSTLPASTTIGRTSPSVKSVHAHSNGPVSKTTLAFRATSVTYTPLPTLTTGVSQSCSLQEYNRSRQMCCQSGNQANIFDRQPSRSCCRSMAYNYNTDVCCWDTGIIYQPADKARGYSCCGSRLYRARDQLCCNGRVLDRTSLNTRCCGASAYNYGKHLCCNGRILARPGYMSQNYACCGTRVFNRRNDLCCMGRIKWKSSSHDACCKTVPYNTATSLCCNRPYRLPQSGGHLYRCCGSGTYNFQSEICCSGTRYRVPETTHGCCRAAAYNKTRELCCSGRVVSLNGTDSNRVMCCDQGVYDVYREICCSRKIMVKQYGASSACCGTGQYNVTNEVCCRNNQVQLATWLDNGSRC